MRRFLVVFVLAAAVAGCSFPRLLQPEPTPRSRFLEGFAHGYGSAFPDQPYTRDEKAYVTPDSFQSRNQAYQQGWKSGYQAGQQDLKQQK
jgi:hypothetical protein